MSETTFDVVPSIDLIGGKCVRLRQGDFADVTEFGDDPLDIALQFQDAGLKRLHVVDLDGARQRQVVHWEVLKRLAAETTLAIDFSGGITDIDQAQRAFDYGAWQVAIGSLAVRQPDVFRQMLTRFGPDAIILSADVRDGIVQVAGWTETTTLTIDALIHQFQSERLTWLMATDIARDGMLQGPSVDLYRRLRDDFPQLKILASGGVSTPSDVHALKKLGIAGAVIGRALLEGDLDASALEAYQS